jgi:hypothetical protein
MYHAVAIDEHRKAFDATLWTGFQPSGGEFDPLKPDQTLEQRWFVGDHCNVGGGQRSDALAQIPLRWMLEKAESCGLTFKRKIEVASETALAPISDSFGDFAFGAYRLLRLNQRHYRQIGRPPRATLRRPGTSHVLNETIDASVFDRWRADPSYRPKNLAAWAKSAGVDPDAVHGDTPVRPKVAAPGRSRARR